MDDLGGVLKSEKQELLEYLEELKRSFDSDARMNLPRPSDGSTSKLLKLTEEIVIDRMEKRIKRLERQRQYMKGNNQKMKQAILRVADKVKEGKEVLEKRDELIQKISKQMDEKDKEIKKRDRMLDQYKQKLKDAERRNQELVQHTRNAKVRNNKILEEIENDRLKLFHIETNQVKVGAEIDKGAFGRVCEAEWTFSRNCAVKEIKIYQIPGPELLKEFRDQVSLLHPCILRTFGYTVETTRVLIVMERMDTNLTKYVFSQKPRLKKKLYLMSKMAEGLSFLHGRTPVILHRDLKGCNFLVSSDGDEVKISDFGMTTTFSTSSVSFKYSNKMGTPQYMAPEILNENAQYSVFSDVYALGIAYWECLFESIPYNNLKLNIFTLMANVGKGRRPDLSHPRCPEELKSLLRSMWHSERKRRPTSSQVMEWFRKNTVRIIEKYSNIRFP